jgi:ABC-type branched-subunit amino acid transport system substrate-binding protein
MKRAAYVGALLTAALVAAVSAQKVETPVKIGVAVAQTSNTALLGQEQVIGARFAEKYLNARGGINGTPFKLIFQDAAGDENSAINAFQNLINKERVVGIVGPTDGGNLVKQLRQLGYKGLIIGGNGLNTSNMFPVCQKLCDGVIIAQAYSPAQPSAANQVFVKDYRAQYKKDPPQFAAQAYTAVQVMVEALRAIDRKKKLATWDVDELRVALNKQILAGKYNTPLGPISFDKEGELNQREFYVAQIRMKDAKNGSFVYLK